MAEFATPSTRDAADRTRFAELVARSERLGRRLPFTELRELARLYRIHSARLALERTRARDPEEIRYLNALCVRAYAHVYAPQRSRSRKRGLWLSELPDTLATTWKAQLLSTALLVLGIVLGAGLSHENPQVRAGLVPFYSAEALERLATSHEARQEFLGRQDTPVAANALFGTHLFVHNTRVGLLSFAAGVLAGIPTLILLVYNGLTLGAFGSLFTSDPDSSVFWAWIIPHGIPELLAILLCSTGGLLLGGAIVAPGRVGASRALRAQARRALPLLAASVPLFLVAAGIESFVRQSTLSTPARFGVAATAVAVLLGYVALVVVLRRRTLAPNLGWLGAPQASEPQGQPISPA